MNNFKELNNELIIRLNKIGIKKATEIQNKAIFQILNGGDIVISSKTGSGKTLAFAIPTYEKLEKNKKILIITPTRELAIQIFEEYEKINYKNKKIIVVYGGKDISVNSKDIESGFDIIIGTPGRLKDLYEKNILNKKDNYQYLILDEVDQILLMGFREEIDYILNKINKNRENIFISATIDGAVKKIIYRIAKNPIFIDVQEKEDYSHINQKYLETTPRRKLNTLAQILNDNNIFMGIIFCRTKARVDKLEDELTKKGYSCQKIHSDIPQTKREKILKSFKKVEFQLLIATDLASRGIDITGVTHIFNYDAPIDLETYIHRIGRTGRGKEKGESYIFFIEDDKDIKNNILNHFENKLEKISIEYKDDIISTIDLPKNKYNKKINTKTKNIEKMRNKYRK